jgi:hypothetical protein
LGVRKKMDGLGYARQIFGAIRCAADATVVTIQRDCVPNASAETPILVLLDLIELGALDLWIEDQPDPKPSRQEAARRVISEALMRD